MIFRAIHIDEKTEEKSLAAVATTVGNEDDISKRLVKNMYGKPIQPYATA